MPFRVNPAELQAEALGVSRRWRATGCTQQRLLLDRVQGEIHWRHHGGFAGLLVGAAEGFARIATELGQDGDFIARLAQALRAAYFDRLGSAVRVRGRGDDARVSGFFVAPGSVDFSPDGDVHGDGFSLGWGSCCSGAHDGLILSIWACNSGQARPANPLAGSTFLGSPVMRTSSTRSAKVQPVTSSAWCTYLP